MFNAKDGHASALDAETDEPLIEEQFVQARYREEELTSAYGNHTLAFFGLAPENLHFLAPDGKGLVNYRLTRNIAVVLGDPICAPEDIEAVLSSFLDFCTQHKWHVALYQVYPQYLKAYRKRKLRAFKMGEEAMLNPQTFTLQGSALANVRTSCRRAERDGVTIQWFEGVPPTEVLQQLEDLNNIWLESKAGDTETGFSVGRFDDIVAFAERADNIAERSGHPSSSQAAIPHFLTAVAYKSTGEACSFMTFTPVYNSSADASQSGEWGWTLDIMRRTTETPPGVMELLLVHALERFRSQGATVLSLGLVAWSDTQNEIFPLQRKLASFATDRLHLLETHDTLFKFKQKFHPRWESRYIVSRLSFSLPQVAFGILRVRNYSRGVKKLV
jgi:phosphatidylglycerol lysyltransferase